MANVNSVIVLAPNGRRQTVKVTPNSTVLQVLEEVCNKHDFDPQEYDIRHHTRVLDATMTVQFSRLPNNAQLELVKAKKMRRESEVLVNVQTESGNRLSGSFQPSDSLWDVISKLYPGIDTVNKYPAIVYMRQEICGISNLKSTTLRCLGLTNGRALLRLVYKSIEGDAPQQSTVGSKLNTAAVTQITKGKDSSMEVDPHTTEKSLKPEAKVLSESSVKNVVKTSPVPERKTLIGISENMPVSHKSSDKPSAIQHSPSENVSCNKKLRKEIVSTCPKGMKDQQVKHSSQESQNIQSIQNSSLEDILSTPIEPRDRNPVVFKRGTPRASAGEDLPDEFFELTLDDVRYLYRDLKNKRTEMNDAPLQTSAIKKLEESKRILNNLHKYKRAVIRIQFPDETILQGSFSPIETIQNVKEFVQQYLEKPSMSFYLYTTPPKVILKPSDRLVEANCVPCAVLYFGMNASESAHYLRSDVLSGLSSQEAASAAVTKSRGYVPTPLVERSIPAPLTERSVPSTSGMQAAVPSTSGTRAPRECEESSTLSSDSIREPQQTVHPNGKVPKWFKLTPK